MISIVQMQRGVSDMTKEAIVDGLYRGDSTAIKDAINVLQQPPCEDAISRQDTLKTIIKHLGIRSEEYLLPAEEAIYKVVKNMPPVTPAQRWTPVSEKLPNDRDWYLGIFKEPDTGWINPLPFICDYVGSETKATTKEYWILRGFTDMDGHIDYYFNLECVAWMPLPKPYEGETE